LELIGAIALLVRVLGWFPIIPVIGICILFFPIQGQIGRLTARLRSTTVKVTDARVRRLGEIFSSIRLVKLCGWEEGFAELVSALRGNELEKLVKVSIVKTLNVAFGWSVP
jgi:hypothetical protein